MAAQKAGGAADWISRHLWQIGTALAVLYTGYLTGQMKAEAKIEALEYKIARNEAESDKRLAAIEAKMKGRFVFMGDAVPIINYLCGKDAECRKYYGPVEMPE